jgi:hypothetical protein
MEHERSLPHSHEPSNFPYPEPDQCSPHHPMLSLQDHLNIIHRTCVLFSLVVTFPLAFLPITHMLSYFPDRATCPAHFILIIPAEVYNSRSSSSCSPLHPPMTSSHFVSNILSTSCSQSSSVIHKRVIITIIILSITLLTSFL